MSSHNWHILGAGSLGCLWAARLQLSRQSVSLALRNPRSLANYLAAGSRIHYLPLQKKTAHSLIIPAQLPDNPQPVSRLILACKAYDAVAAMQSIQHRLQPGCRIFLLQNGMGSQQAILQLLPDCRIIAASTTEGAFMTEPFHCTHAGKGTTLLGDLGQPGTAPAELDDWRQAGFDCQWSENIGAVLWRKLAINCLINPLTVLYQCRNGELMQYLPRLEALAEDLAALLSTTAFPCKAAELFALACEVIQNTARNTSSMLQDVRNKRRTEISYITGFALAQSQQLNLPHQQLQAVHQELRQHLLELGLPPD